jgi:GT2 family glycosyltransferase
LQEALSTEEAAALRRRAERLARDGGPLISVLMPVYDPPLPFLAAAIDSVQRQVYPNWELCIADDASRDPGVRALLAARAAADPRIKVVFRETNGHISAASNSALELVSGSHVALLDHDDELAPTALYWVVDALHDNPDAALVYSDEDKVDTEGVRSGPYLKCDFNYDLFLSHNMVSHLGVYRTTLLRELGGFRVGYEGSQDYDVALRFVERVRPAQIVHVPRVLYHWRTIPGSTAATTDAKPYAFEAAKRAITDHLRRRGIRADVVESPDCEGTRVRYRLSDPAPRVLIVIPTRDRLDLLAPCIESITTKSIYTNYRICVVDNGSVEPRTLEYLSRLRRAGHAVLRDDSPFNYSRLNNRAVREHGGDAEFVCLLNNDTEVVSPSWLEELVGHAIQPGVGCVGARLWYPDGRIQHAGIVMGLLTCAGHAHRFAPRGNAGYMGRAALQQSFSAVTAACLVVSRAIYDAVGGLDETLTVAFNDVDFCLRVRGAGYRNVWTPYAELVHHESVSRGEDDTPEKQGRFLTEVATMRERWKHVIENDPCYSPHLTLDAEDFSRAPVSRVPRFHAA